MKKQVKKITKKILILSLATSLIFTSCFSHKKIEVHAAAATATLSAWTLYEICLYFGTLAVSALGIGYAYENRDEIAEFGKSVIDTMSELPAEGWMFGSYAADSSYVYGTEALQEVQDTAWTVIQGGGQSPKNDDDNDGDGDKDADDRTLELDLTGYFLTQTGVDFFNNTIKPIYDKWVNKEEDNILRNKFGLSDMLFYIGDLSDLDNDGYLDIQGYCINSTYNESDNTVDFSTIKVPSSCRVAVYNNNDALQFKYAFIGQSAFSNISLDGRPYAFFRVSDCFYSTNMPIFTKYDSMVNYFKTGIISDIENLPKVYRVADWIAEDEAWKGHLEDLATSLRSLQDLFNIAQQLTDGALTTQPSADAYGDMMVDLGNEYAPLLDPVTDPVYWPATNPTPVLDPSVFPNYQPGTNPDPGTDPEPGTDPDNPGDDSGGETPDDTEIDLDGLLSLFNILLYLIMIIIMLIFLFLACLAFIVMIFRIPASSSMLPEEMVMGFEHLKTIMIPGMNISIYGFAMALIYMFIIFAVIRALRLEINDFKIPRSFKK